MKRQPSSSGVLSGIRWITPVVVLFLCLVLVGAVGVSGVVFWGLVMFFVFVVVEVGWFKQRLLVHLA